MHTEGRREASCILNGQEWAGSGRGVGLWSGWVGRWSEVRGLVGWVGVGWSR